MTARKPFQTQWVHRDDEVRPEPLSTRMQKARRLPMFGPGIVIAIPLHLWIEYHQALYSLEPNGVREPKFKPANGPGEAILLVKRIKKEKTDGRK